MKASRTIATHGIVGAKSDWAFNILMKILMLFIGFITVFPLYYVLISSISSGTSVDLGQVLFYPIDINFESYMKVVVDDLFWTSNVNTFFYTGVGTLYSMLITTTAAYALSKSNFKWRKQLNLAIAFTMWFQAGFIPMYLNYKGLGVMDDRWGIIVSFGVQAFNVILMRNYFENVPKELDEAARIDGANDFRIFTSIYLPISGPALATVGIYYAVSRWNAFFWSMVLLKKTELIPFQVYLQHMIINEQLVLDNQGSIGDQLYSFTTLKYALILCSLIPVLVIFPIIQRYFSRGIMLGGVKE